MKNYFRPVPILDPAQRGAGKCLAGGWLRFSDVECLNRDRPPSIWAADDLPEYVLDRLTAPRAPIAGLDMAAPRLMGILNVTPDSFSDGGAHHAQSDAVARAHAMIQQGADLIDIGGESTRPGAREVDVDQEISRVTPIISTLQADGITAPISLDTRKSAVAASGLAAGAHIVNDVSGLRFDPEIAHVAARSNAPMILMHSIGTPETMQDLAAAGAYDEVLLDVYDVLEDAILQAEAAGVPRAQIVVDPGIGFGKTDAENRAFMARISLFHGLGCPVMLGASRKGFVGRHGHVPNAADRGPGSTALGLWAVSQGVQFLRIHDIEMHRQAIALWRAVAEPT